MQQFNFQHSIFKPSRLIAIFLLSVQFAFAQQTDQMSIEEVIDRATTTSLLALKSTNIYLAGYWQYNSYKASLLPQVNLKLTPVDYNRSFSQQWNSNEEAFAYYETQTLNNYSTVSIDQNLAFSGGTLSLQSSLDHLENLTDDQYSAFNASPVQLAYTQPILGFNDFKWKKKLSPLAYELAKREYLEVMQQARLFAINYYFDLLIAQVSLEIAKSNQATSDTLYHIGLKRFEIASITKEDLLNLELNKYSASIEVARTGKEVKVAQYNLTSFLGMSKDALITPMIPENNFVKNIPLEKAIENGMRYNPEPLRLEESMLEAEKNLDQINKDTRFNANVVAQFGLNNSDKTLRQTYNNLTNRQAVAVGIQIPLVDWGQGKGERMLALKQMEVAQIEMEQSKMDFEQEIVLNVIDYNLQHQLVENALRAAEISEEAYQLTKKRFILGNVDVLKLNASAEARQQEKESYIDALYNLWRVYYEIQELTLFDYGKDTPLSADFDSMIK
ncbi:TolC family protein [Chondrinema litorale]|uniref:TolC family protein n=1 Tax=Chondrinema litorale TaxID=2994555 RepID=UPI002542F659|nr:TolC family protein [Chondrinema litorale]UZR97352.1 TolC family protein [Chondrinema litorale]